MTRERLLLVFSLLVLIVFGLVLTLKLTAPKEFATVKFKDAIAEVKENGQIVKKDQLYGEVIMKDKYVVVKTSDSKDEHIFTWDQIKSISEGREDRSKQVDDVVDLIEFVSKLGIIAAIIIFLVGLFQYEQSQKWKKEEFLAGAVKDFIASPWAANARVMLDSLRLYKKGVKVQLYPNKDPKDQYKHVSNETIYSALDTDPDKDFDDDEIAIRDSFDSFFGHLEKLNHYIKNGLVSRKSVYTYLSYPINMLGKKGLLNEKDRSRLLHYASFFEFSGVKELLDRYKKQLRQKGWASTALPSTELKKSDPGEKGIKTDKQK